MCTCIKQLKSYEKLLVESFEGVPDRVRQEVYLEDPRWHYAEISLKSFFYI